MFQLKYSDFNPNKYKQGHMEEKTLRKQILLHFKFISDVSPKITF